MKNKIKLIFLTFLLCINCNKKSPLHKEKKDKSIWFVGMKDTTIKQQLKNSYLIYQLQGDSVYEIKWETNPLIMNQQKNSKSWEMEF